MRCVSIKELSGSVAFRIASLFTVTFALGLSISFFATYFEVAYSLEKSSHEVISTKLQEVAAILVHDNVKGLKTTLSAEKNFALNAPFLIRVLDLQGNLIYLKPDIREKNFDLDSILKTTGVPELGWHKFEAINDEDVFDLLTEKVGGEYFVQIGRSSEDRQSLLESISAGFTISAIVMIILGGLVGVWYASRALKPVRELIQTTREIEAGDLSRRVSVAPGRGELQDLASTFNKMINRLEKVMFIMRESIDHLAHDIRTPLARVRAVAEDAILKDNRDQKEALADCAEAVQELSALVDQVLSVSEAEAGTMALQLEPVDVHKLLGEVADLYEVIAENKQQSLQVRADIQSAWVMDRKRIKRVIANLVDNALKFSPEGSMVSVSAIESQNALMIEVSDQGPGIAEADLSRIWDRLFRSDRSRSTKGSGLGLAIAKALVEAHSGSITVDPHEGPGVTFTVKIPRLKT
ncbi:MAG: HAMP domain-containing protein [Bdellovibrionaceae bacterium]|nr:HAMP domain-containing protein [Pseudobdellovibrionaceae bacterium]